MSKSQLTRQEIFDRHKAGESDLMIARAAGISVQAIGKRLKGIHQVDRTPEAVQRDILRNLDAKTIEGMSVPQQAAILRTLSKGGRAERRRLSTAEDAARLRARFDANPIDLNLARAIPCSSCGEYPATEAHPVCVRCRPDVPYDFVNDGGIDAARIARYTLCENCGKNNATSRRDNPGKKALCNSCRKALDIPARWTKPPEPAVEEVAG